MCCVAIITLFQKGYENDFFFVCYPKNIHLIPYKGPECVFLALSVYIWSSARYGSRDSLIQPIQRKPGYLCEPMISGYSLILFWNSKMAALARTDFSILVVHSLHSG